MVAHLQATERTFVDAARRRVTCTETTENEGMIEQEKERGRHAFPRIIVCVVRFHLHTHISIMLLCCGRCSSKYGFWSSFFACCVLDCAYTAHILTYPHSPYSIEHALMEEFLRMCSVHKRKVSSLVFLVVYRSGFVYIFCWTRALAVWKCRRAQTQSQSFENGMTMSTILISSSTTHFVVAERFFSSLFHWCILKWFADCSIRIMKMITSWSENRFLGRIYIYHDAWMELHDRWIGAHWFWS